MLYRSQVTSIYITATPNQDHLLLLTQWADGPVAFFCILLFHLIPTDMTVEQKLLGVLIGLELIACVVIYDMVYNVLPELPTAVAVAVSIG